MQLPDEHGFMPVVGGPNVGEGDIAGLQLDSGVGAHQFDHEASHILTLHLALGIWKAWMPIFFDCPPL